MKISRLQYNMKDIRRLWHNAAQTMSGKLFTQIILVTEMTYFGWL